MGGDNKLIIWDVASGAAICGEAAANEPALCCSFVNASPFCLVSAGKYNFRVWRFDAVNRKLRPTDVKLGPLKRTFNCIAITDDDETAYTGTQSGDILQISLKHCLFQKRGPNNGKAPFAMGVQSIALTEDNASIVAGSGNGVIALLDRNSLTVTRSTQLDTAPKDGKNDTDDNMSLQIRGGKKVASTISPAITSLAINAAGDHFFVGTSKASIFLVAVDDFDYELRWSAHCARINDVVFPRNCSDLFVTAGVHDIRVWNLYKQRELLRIHVANVECLCVALSADGKSIVSGWNDGKVRAFYPESGRPMYTIHDCHAKEVTAIALTADGNTLLTGGNDSLVRIWRLSRDLDTNQVTHKMVASLREHQNAVSYICINSDDTEFVTASADGSCVVWDVNKASRVNALFASTQVSCVLYHPDDSQMVTSGARQITYWDAGDLSQIRIVDASDKATTNKLAINASGTHFVSVSEDATVKLWSYDEGTVDAVGIAHSGNIKACKISPDNQHIVSVGDEGAICIWKMPANENSNVNKAENENSNEINLQPQ